MRYNNISVSISSSESDSELRAMNSAIVHFARLQQTTSQSALTLCHAVFPVLRLPALLCPVLPCVHLRLNVRPALVVQLMVHKAPAAWCIVMVSVSNAAVCATQLPIGGKAKRRH